MVFALIFLSPIVFCIAVFLTFGGLRYGPQGIPIFLWIPLLFVWLMGAMSTFFTVWLLGVDGAEAQRRLLGRHYAGVLQLRGYQNSEMPDPGQEWRYRLDRETTAQLRPRCRALKGTPPNICYLYYEADDRVHVTVTLDGDELTVADWSM